MAVRGIHALASLRLTLVAVVVKALFAPPGQSKSATADPTGRWFVRLDPMSASAVGRELLVESTIGNRKSNSPMWWSVIAKPVAVRYGWAMMPDGNLFNREGLPAAPFRTDGPADLTCAVKSN